MLDQGLTRDEIFKQTGQTVGVQNANLTVQRGEICVLMGLSGSGKSSLLRCINGLNTVSRGRLLIEHEGAEVDIANCSAAMLKAMRTKRIAMVFQKFALMPWLTVAENISFGLEMQGRPSAERKKTGQRKARVGELDASGETSDRTSCPAACNSAWAWRVRWQWMLIFC
ncbi:Glycine betaine/choline transport system ATP-binding protein OusV [Polaromonas vacuolata]|uniref:Glycine betaine/choline transport system ATP-binding protein OusV n=1 Tax=Polaromonas vacuolata TaxID=37448 RepID=A0A6H2HA19_9BURK|nr:ATP-binding cassette domain-containing protein [Polaromonas vacuolata]QJC56670.1 Glycine betaine/choline transport system ATP-binding protein OusV [Polaromonas vacuolata]